MLVVFPLLLLVVLHVTFSHNVYATFAADFGKQIVFLYLISPTLLELCISQLRNIFSSRSVKQVIWYIFTNTLMVVLYVHKSPLWSIMEPVQNNDQIFSTLSLNVFPLKQPCDQNKGHSTPRDPYNIGVPTLDECKLPDKLLMIWGVLQTPKSVPVSIC